MKKVWEILPFQILRGREKLEKCVNGMEDLANNNNENE